MPVVFVREHTRGCCAWYGNFLWILLAGWYTALIWLAFAIILCITIVGIPFGKQCWKMAKLSFLPFGYEVRSKAEPTCGHCCSCCCNVLWFIPGLIIALFYVLASLLFFITIIGIPFGIQCCKLARLALTPFGYEATLPKTVVVSSV